MCIHIVCTGNVLIWDIEDGTKIGEYEGISNACILTFNVAIVSTGVVPICIV